MLIFFRLFQVSNTLCIRFFKVSVIEVIMSIDKYIKKLDSPLKEIVIELRAIVNNSSSDLQEAIKWNVPTYFINSNICSIMAHKNHVNLQIFSGAHIKAANLLDGNGKDMRHIKFANKEDIDSRVIEKILAQAIALDSKGA